MRLPDATTHEGRLRWAGVVAVLVAVAAVAVVGWRATSGAVVPEVVGYEVLSDTEVTVDYLLSRPEGTAVTCRIAALDVRKARVGVAEDLVPAGGPAVVRREVTVRTSARAVTGVVESCVREGVGAG